MVGCCVARLLHRYSRRAGHARRRRSRPRRGRRGARRRLRPAGQTPAATATSSCTRARRLRGSSARSTCSRAEGTVIDLSWYGDTRGRPVARRRVPLPAARPSASSQVGAVSPARARRAARPPTDSRSPSSCCATPRSTRCSPASRASTSCPTSWRGWPREAAGALPHDHLRRGVGLDVQRHRPRSHDDRAQLPRRGLRPRAAAARRDLRRRCDVPRGRARRRRHRRRHRPGERGAARGASAELDYRNLDDEPSLRRHQHDDRGARPADRRPARRAVTRAPRRGARARPASSSRCTSRPSPGRPTSVRCERRPLRRPRGIDDPARPSGGNAYDRRVCRGLAAAGWTVHEHAVPESWPRRIWRRAALARDPSRRLGRAARRARRLARSRGARSGVATACGWSSWSTCRSARTGRTRGAGAVLAAVACRHDHERVGAAAGFSSATPCRPSACTSPSPGVEAAGLAPGTESGGSLLCGRRRRSRQGPRRAGRCARHPERPQWRCLCVGTVERDPAFVASLRDRADAGRRGAFLRSAPRGGSRTQLRGGRSARARVPLGELRDGRDRGAGPRSPGRRRRGRRRARGDGTRRGRHPAGRARASRRPRGAGAALCAPGSGTPICARDCAARRASGGSRSPTGPTTASAVTGRPGEGARDGSRSDPGQPGLARPTRERGRRGTLARPRRSAAPPASGCRPARRPRSRLRQRLTGALARSAPARTAALDPARPGRRSACSRQDRAARRHGRDPSVRRHAARRGRARRRESRHRLGPARSPHSGRAGRAGSRLRRRRLPGAARALGHRSRAAASARPARRAVGGGVQRAPAP